MADISKQTGKAKSVIRDNLVKAGVELREKVAVAILKMKAEKGKTSIHPRMVFVTFKVALYPIQKSMKISC